MSLSYFLTSTKSVEVERKLIETNSHPTLQPVVETIASYTANADNPFKSQ